MNMKAFTIAQKFEELFFVSMRFIFKWLPKRFSVKSKVLQNNALFTKYIFSN